MGAYFTIWSMSRMGGGPGGGGRTEITEAGRDAAYRMNVEAQKKAEEKALQEKKEKHTYTGDLSITTPISIHTGSCHVRQEWRQDAVEDFIMSHTKGLVPEIIDVIAEPDTATVEIFVQIKLSNASFICLDKKSGEIELTSTTINKVKEQVRDMFAPIQRSMQEIGRIDEEHIAYNPDMNTIKQAVSNVYNEKSVFKVNEYSRPSEQFPMLAQYTHTNKLGMTKDYTFIVTNFEYYK